MTRHHGRCTGDAHCAQVARSESLRLSRNHPTEPFAGAVRGPRGLGQVPPAGASCARAPIAAGATRAMCASGGERPSRCPQADRGARARLAVLLRPPEPRAAFIRNGVRRTLLVERFPTFRIFSLRLHTKERVLPVDRQWTARPRCRTRRRSASPGTGRAGTRRRCPGPGPAVDANIPGPGAWR